MKIRFIKLLKLKRIIKKAISLKKSTEYSRVINNGIIFKDLNGNELFVSKKDYESMVTLFQKFINIIFLK